MHKLLFYFLNNFIFCGRKKLYLLLTIAILSDNKNLLHETRYKIQAFSNDVP